MKVAKAPSPSSSLALLVRNGDVITLVENIQQGPGRETYELMSKATLYFKQIRERGHGCKTMLSVSYLCSVFHVGLVQQAFNSVPLSAEDLISICRTGTNVKALVSGPMENTHESHHVTPSKVRPVL